MLISFSTATDWNIPGNDPGHSSYTPETVMPPLDIQWISSSYVSDTYPIEPVIVAGNVLYTRETERDGNLSVSGLYARSTRDGSLIWKLPQLKPAGTFEDKVAAWGNGSVVVIKNGSEVWRKDVSSDIPPLLYKDLLIAGNFTTFGTKNGSIIWDYYPKVLSRDSQKECIHTFLPLTASEDTIIIAVNTFGLSQEMNKTSEPFKWGNNSQIAFSVKQNFRQTSGTLIALDATSGKELWIQEFAQIFEYTPIISSGKVFIGTNGSVQCFGLKDGKNIWKTYLAGHIRTLSADPESLFVDDKFGRNITSLRVDTGDVVWVYNHPGISRTVSVSGPILYITSSDSSAGIEGLDKKTGTLIWKGKIPGDWTSPSQAVISHGRIYVRTMLGKTYTFTSHQITPDKTKLGTKQLSFWGINSSLTVISTNTTIRELL